MKKSIIIVLLSALVGGGTAYFVAKSVTSDPVITEVKKGDNFRSVEIKQSDYPDFTYAAETAVDAVVYVKVTVRDTYQPGPSSILEYFFGHEGSPKQRERQGSGSGVIIRKDGYIVTNNHVIDGASEIEVTLNNNKTYKAELIGTDPATDVALLKIDAEGLPVLPFGNSDDLRLGEWVIAIGSPYDLRSTITAGIVSAKGRSMPNYSGEFKIEAFIQTDAAVNPGNSGGALVDKAGNLIGVNTAIISQTGSYTGYSFAIPSNMVKKIVDDLIDFGSVKRAILGISMQEINEEIAEELKLSSLNGVYIAEVVKGSAADKAGIEAKDVLIQIDSTKITNAASVQEKVNSYRPGDKADLIVIRKGKEKVVVVEFKGMYAENGTVSEDGELVFYGANLKELSKDKKGKFGVKHGVEVTSVGPGKVMDSGIPEGFIILYVNEIAIKEPQDIIDIVKKSKRSVFIEGITAYGKSGYFGFGI